MATDFDVLTRTYADRRRRKVRIVPYRAALIPYPEKVVIDLTSVPDGEIEDDNFCEIVGFKLNAAATVTVAQKVPPLLIDLVLESSKDTTSKDVGQRSSFICAAQGHATATAATPLSAAVGISAAPAPKKRRGLPLHNKAHESNIEWKDEPVPSHGTKCSGCQAGNQARMYDLNLQASKRQLHASSTIVLLSPSDASQEAAEVEAITAMAGPHSCVGCRRMAMQAMADAAQARVCDIVRQHPLGNPRGFLFEVHHAASFNIAAIRAGSLLRAECMEICAADIRLYDINSPRVSLARAQLKSSDKTLNVKKLRLQKYDGMLKVTLREMAKGARDWSSILLYDGVSSKPLSKEQLAGVFGNPRAHFQDMVTMAMQSMHR